MLLYILQLVLTALIFFNPRSSQKHVADALPSSLISSNDTVIGTSNLDCVCQAYDEYSIFKISASWVQSSCTEGFDLFLSAYNVTSSKIFTQVTCSDLLQLLPQDYCGYPDDDALFSLDKISSTSCSSTKDKEKCSFETFRQPNTPCNWSPGRSCYWDSTTGECQGTVSNWFVQTYHLDSSVRSICSIQKSKSTCRNTVMLKGHCTSLTLDGVDSDRVCATKTDLSACDQTTFSALRACAWKEKTVGREATYANCCTSALYRRPLAGIVWCGIIGLNYVLDGRISATIGILSCDDIAGTHIPYLQSRDTYLDFYGPTFVSNVDEACCRAPEERSFPPSPLPVKQTKKPTKMPTEQHTEKPTNIANPTKATFLPTLVRLNTASLLPTMLKTDMRLPTKNPLITPSNHPSVSPSKSQPNGDRTKSPSAEKKKTYVSKNENTIKPSEYPSSISSQVLKPSKPTQKDDRPQTDNPRPLPKSTTYPSQYSSSISGQELNPSNPKQNDGWPQHVNPSKATTSPSLAEQTMTSMQPATPKTEIKNPSMKPSYQPSLPPPKSQPNGDRTEAPSANQKETYLPQKANTINPSEQPSAISSQVLKPFNPLQKDDWPQSDNPRPSPKPTTYPSAFSSLISSQVLNPSNPKQNGGWPQHVNPSKATSSPTLAEQTMTSMQPVTPKTEIKNPSMKPSYQPSLSPPKSQPNGDRTETPSANKKETYLPQKASTINPSERPSSFSSQVLKPSNPIRKDNWPQRGNPRPSPKSTTYPSQYSSSISSQVLNPSNPKQYDGWPQHANPSKATSSPTLAEQTMTSMQPVTPKTEIKNPFMKSSYQPSLSPPKSQPNGDRTETPSANKKETYVPQKANTISPSEYPSSIGSQVLKPSSPIQKDDWPQRGNPTPSPKSTTYPSQYSSSIGGQVLNPSNPKQKVDWPQHVNPSKATSSPTPEKQYATSLQPTTAMSRNTPTMDRNAIVASKEGGKSKVGAAATVLLALPLIGLLARWYKRRNSSEENDNDVKLEDI